MKFGSVCSGIEAASVAWNPLGWEAKWFSEIEPFPCSVLRHHYPDTPNYGDMTRFEEWPDGSIDLLCGGTPCQSFSVAGLRKGLDDPRGNLMLTFGAVVRKFRPRWLVWENVPGVLSSNGGRDFGTFLGMLGQLGYGFAYRVLDAAHFGVPQRRRRVFVIGCLGDWRGAAAVLFERHSLQGHPAPRREARKVAPTIPSRSTGGGDLGTDFDCDGGLLTRAHGQGGAEIARDRCATLTCNHESPIVAGAVAIPGNVIGRKPHNGGNGIGADASGVMYTLTKTDIHAVAHTLRGEGFDASEDGTGRGTPLVSTLTSNGDAHSGFRDEHGLIAARSAVRRLTPRECERLQGFPDDYTLIPYRGKAAADGPRYKALGNSWAVPVVRWIGKRIKAVEAIKSAKDDE
ncbi:DNA cytosine methyltransferase [Petrachloros mirabilis]